MHCRTDLITGSIFCHIAPPLWWLFLHLFRRPFSAQLLSKTSLCPKVNTECLTVNQVLNKSGTYHSWFNSFLLLKDYNEVIVRHLHPLSSDCVVCLCRICVSIAFPDAILCIWPRCKIGRREGREGERDKGLSQNSQMSEPKNQTGHGWEKGGEGKEGGREEYRGFPRLNSLVGSGCYYLRMLRSMLHD